MCKKTRERGVVVKLEVVAEASEWGAGVYTAVVMYYAKLTGTGKSTFSGQQIPVSLSLDGTQWLGNVVL